MVVAAANKLEIITLMKDPLPKDDESLVAVWKTIELKWATDHPRDTDIEAYVCCWIVLRWLIEH